MTFATSIPFAISSNLEHLIQETFESANQYKAPYVGFAFIYLQKLALLYVIHALWGGCFVRIDDQQSVNV